VQGQVDCGVSGSVAVCGSSTFECRGPDMRSATPNVSGVCGSDAEGRWRDKEVFPLKGQGNGPKREQSLELGDEEKVELYTA